MEPTFVKLNLGWNAEPNDPNPEVQVVGADLILRFTMNPFRFPEFQAKEQGLLRFVDFSKFRLGPTNDEGWHLGQCRFSGKAPNWGEFYAILNEPASAAGPDDWVVVNASAGVP